jgi:hypothetical protein
MSTRKKTVVKRKAAKKVTARTATKRVATPKQPKTVTKDVVKEVFSTVPQARQTVEVPRNSVALFVNGTDKGLIDTTGQKLGEFAIAQAQRHGIRTFSMYVDGRKADSTDADKLMENFGKLEIVAKDSRG